MRVKVTLYFPFREELPTNPLELDLPEGATIAQAVEALATRFPSLRTRLYDAQGQVHRHISALVNGVSIQYKRGWSTPLAHGDEVVLLPPVGGG